MKRIIIFLICIVVFITFSICIFGQSADYISLITKAKPNKDGSYNLAKEQAINLNQLIGSLLEKDTLGESAIAYLQNDGWKKVEVKGMRRLKLEDEDDTDEYLIVYCSPYTYILEPRTYSSLQPGQYLGKMGFVTCEIIDRNGDEENFWTKDTR